MRSFRRKGECPTATHAPYLLLGAIPFVWATSSAKMRTWTPSLPIASAYSPNWLHRFKERSKLILGSVRTGGLSGLGCSILPPSTLALWSPVSRQSWDHRRTVPTTGRAPHCGAQGRQLLGWLT